MTDTPNRPPLEPNDLSHLSDEEFMALCPIGEHAPGPEPLSPAAQAVLDAWLKSENGERMLGDPACLAAALRAAALYCTRERRILMAIADELEGHA